MTSCPPLAVPHLLVYLYSVPINIYSVAGIYTVTALYHQFFVWRNFSFRLVWYGAATSISLWLVGILLKHMVFKLG